MIRGIFAFFMLGIPALMLFAVLVSESKRCTVNDPPGPAIAGVVRIGGCP